jgi:hypothetical protein
MDIQSLIDDIDGILLMAASRPLWFKPGDPVRERQVLERVRSYLVSQQQGSAASRQPHSGTTSLPREAVQQIVQTVSQEMAVLRNDLIQPLQADLTVLRQQRESLVEEIRQMKQSKQELGLSAGPTQSQQLISEFSQELISRCTASLTQQFGHILEGLETRWSGAIMAAEATNSVATRGGKAQKTITPQERLEQLRQLQAESDRLLSTLDANQRVIFETIQSNLQSYQESLSQGLEKMHHLGIQGETLFTALINRLAQQWGREASSLLQSSLQSAETKTTLEPVLSKEGRTTSLETPLLPLPLPKPPTETNQQTNTPSISEFQALTEDNFSEQLNSEEWEIIEGIDGENLDVAESDRVDTFLQLDLETENSAAPQDLDYLLGLINEPEPPPDPLSRQGELTGLEALDQAAELNTISDQRRQEIDDLYKSLFGGDSLMNPASDAVAESHPPAIPDADIPDQISDQMSLDLLTNGSAVLPPVEEILFEGLQDPAIQSTQGQTEDWSTRTSSESWDLFFDHSSPQLPVETGTETNLTASETSVEQETITTIAALTDLFEEMGLGAAPVITNEMPVISPSEPVTPSEADPANLVDDLYVAASPDEDLLATETLEVAPERPIQLDQNTLQQLSNDLYSFEDAQSRNFSLASIPLDNATTAPRSDNFLMSDELLAEDWEEFVFPSWPDDDLTANLTEETVSTEASQAATSPSLPEALDFEPDLFPSEALEFDEESVNKAADEHLSDEYIAFEDEIVIDEIEWDDATDGTMEAIASPLEFGEPGKQNALLIGQEDVANPNSILPIAENAATDFEQQSLNGQITPQNPTEEDTADETSSEPQKLLSPAENALNTEPPATNIQDLDLAQPDALNSQPDRENLPNQTDHETKDSSEEIKSSEPTNSKDSSEEKNLSEPSDQETKDNP